MRTVDLRGLGVRRSLCVDTYYAINAREELAFGRIEQPKIICVKQHRDICRRLLDLLTLTGKDAADTVKHECEAQDILKFVYFAVMLKRSRHLRVRLLRPPAACQTQFVLGCFGKGGVVREVASPRSADRRAYSEKM